MSKRSKRSSIFDEREKEKFKWAILRYLRESRATTPTALMTVFRDILHSESFAPLGPQQWRERVEVVFGGVPYDDLSQGVIVTGSEFQIQNTLFPWEQRVEGVSATTRNAREVK